MYSYTERYEPITLTGYKSIKCRICGKRLKRQRTFQQTLSPFNKNEKGETKTVAEIYKELQEKIDEWKGKDIACSTH